MVTGSATLTRGRPLSHSMRKRVHTTGVVRKSLQMPQSDSRVSYLDILVKLFYIYIFLGISVICWISYKSKRVSFLH